MFNLSRYFSTLSLILIGLAAGLLGLLYREVSVHQMTALAEDRNVAMAQIFENALGVPLSGLMAASVGKDASMLQESDESLEMQASVATLMRGTAVAKVKIYNRLGVTIFSTDPTQIGESSLDNPGFKTALSGTVISDLTHRNRMDTFEGVRSDIDLLASYIPISSEGKAVEGVFELYQDVTPFMTSFRHMLWIVTAVVAGVFALLYLMQLLVVRRAQGILHDQAERIEAARSTLEIQIDARTQELRRANRQLEDEVAERRQAESKLNYLAYHDPLTGLANRRYFLERLEASLSDATEKNERVAVLFIDLDQFKQVNDSLGHGVGDELLVSVAAALCEHVRLIDMLARLGGDEFICVMESVRSDEEVAMLAQEVIAATLDVVMHDIYFGDVSDNISNPPVWTVKAGDAMTINLDNQGGLEHNWAIVKQGVEMPIPFMPDENEDLILWAAGVLQAGEKVSEPFPAPTEPGEYLVICTVAGHYPAMQGKLVVQ